MDIEKLKYLSDKGLSQRELAEHFSCSQCKVRYQAKKHGVVLKKKEQEKKYWSDEAFISAVKDSKSAAEVVRSFGLPGNQGYYSRLFREEVRRLELDLSHFDPWAGNRGKTRKIPIEDILVKGSTYNSSNLRTRLIEEKFLEDQCSECGLGPEWNAKALTLQLDHINGISTDNRLANLRILCPNCHTQTPTHSGKNQKRRKKIKRCHDCGVPVSQKSTRCRPCAGALKLNSPPKIDWPSTAYLLSELKTRSYLDLGRELGVSDNAVRKHLKARIGVCPKKYGAG